MRNKTNIESLLSLADQAIATVGILQFNDNNSLPICKEYDGYIAGFGPTVINMGVKATIAFYMKNTNRTPNRIKVIEAILMTATINGPDGNRITKAPVLKDYIINLTNEDMLNRITKILLDASVALKLVIRTYKFKS